MLDAKKFLHNLSPHMSESVYTPEYQIFLAHLKAAREQAGLSQRDLAKRLGKSYSYVAKVETGYARMDIYQIRCYLQAVGAPFVLFMQQYEAALIATDQKSSQSVNRSRSPKRGEATP